MSATLPNILWAQRKDKVFVSVQLGDVKNQAVNLEESSLKFSCESNNKKYAFEMQFLHEIDTDPKKSKHENKGREYLFTLIKKDEDQPFWTKLTKDTVKQKHIRTDFNRWKDEDDDDYEDGGGMGGMGGMGMNDANLEDMMAKMGGAGGAGFDPGEMPDSDSDDEEIPDLED